MDNHESQQKACRCGCGTPTIRPYLVGHWNRRPTPIWECSVEHDVAFVPIFYFDEIADWTRIDSDRLEDVARFRWHPSGNGYAIAGGKSSRAFLHHLILGQKPPAGMMTDHINRDRLDNRRSNLRVVTRGVNMQNVGAHIDSTSRHRGVHWASDRGKWVVQFQIGGRRFSGGVFDDEDEAAGAAAQLRAAHTPGSEEVARVAA